MKPIVIYTDGDINVCYTFFNGKHLITCERENKVVHIQDISHSSKDKYFVDKYLRQMKEPTTSQRQKIYKEKNK